jgi:hypothetical protein
MVLWCFQLLKAHHLKNSMQSLHALNIYFANLPEPHPNQVYRPVIKFWNIEESILLAVQLPIEQDDSESQDSMDAESNSKLEG